MKMSMLSRLYPAACAAAVLVAVSTLTRVALALRPEVATLDAGSLLRGFALGVCFDAAALTYALAPFVLWLVLAPARLSRTRMGEQRVSFSSTVLGGPIGGIVLARDEDDAIAFCNEYAPEHLEVLSKEPFAYLGRLEHAGEILLGEHTPTTLGNYVIGPNHVLPTSGWARTASAVSVFDFIKRTSIAYVTSKGYPELAKHARALATYEGFEAHANAVSETRDRLLKR